MPPALIDGPRTVSGMPPQPGFACAMGIEAARRFSAIAMLTRPRYTRSGTSSWRGPRWRVWASQWGGKAGRRRQILRRRRPVTTAADGCASAELEQSYSVASRISFNSSGDTRSLFATSVFRF